MARERCVSKIHVTKVTVMGHIEVYWSSGLNIHALKMQSYGTLMYG